MTYLEYRNRLSILSAKHASERTEQALRQNQERVALHSEYEALQIATKDDRRAARAVQAAKAREGRARRLEAVSIALAAQKTMCYRTHLHDPALLPLVLEILAEWDLHHANHYVRTIEGGCIVARPVTQTDSE